MGKFLSYYVMPHPPIIIPEIGKGEESAIKNTTEACDKIGREIKDLKPDTIIIVTPHGPLFRDAIAVSSVKSLSGSFREFNAPSVHFKLDLNVELTKSILGLSKENSIQTVEINDQSSRMYNIPLEIDHGSMVPLYFVTKHYTNFKLVHITYGLLSKLELYKFGMLIKKAVCSSNSNAALIASGDLSHRLKNDGPYKYNPAGKIFDDNITSLLNKQDVEGIFSLDENLIKNAGECGLRSFYIMLGAKDGIRTSSELLSYEGPFGVGYGVLKFKTEDGNGNSYYKSLESIEKNRMIKIRKDEDEYVKLARKSLEHYIKYGEYLTFPKNLPSEMINTKRGVFVSLHENGELRGCIGTIHPSYENCGMEIIKNAVEAGENDSRFSPVKEDEFSSIEYSVDVLSEPEKASVKNLDPKTYGVIVRNGSRCGLLLPNLDGVDSVEEQIKIALKKANIETFEDYSIERFTVTRHL